MHVTEPPQHAPATATPAWKRGAGLLAKALVAALCLWYSLTQVSWPDLVAGLRRVEPGAALLAALCAAGNISLVGVRWHAVLAACGIRGGTLPLVRTLLVGTFYNGFVPGGVAGDVVRGLRYSDETRYPKEAVFGSIFLDRLLALLALVGIVLFSLMVGYRSVQGLHVAGVAALAAVGVLAATALLASRRLMHRLGALVQPYAGLYRAAHDVYALLLAARGRHRLLGQALGLALLAHGLVILNFYVLARGMGDTTPLIHFVLIVPMIALVSSLPVSLNGLGIREVSFVLLFPRVGMDPAVALGTALLSFGVNTAVATACGIVGAALQMASGRRPPAP